LIISSKAACVARNTALQADQTIPKHFDRFEQLGTIGTTETSDIWNLWNIWNGWNTRRVGTIGTQRSNEMHPGRILLEEFLAPKGISVWHLARDLQVPVRRIYEVVQGQRAITRDIALQLAHYFGMSERYWLDLQARYDRELNQPPRSQRKVVEIQRGHNRRIFSVPV
jgi:addiction module HigA family antidote